MLFELGQIAWCDVRSYDIVSVIQLVIQLTLICQGRDSSLRLMQWPIQLFESGWAPCLRLKLYEMKIIPSYKV